MTNNKELSMKWIKNLFYMQCVALVATLIAKLPFIGSWFGWIIRIITILSIFMIFKLSPVNARYRKAAILMGISLVLGVVTTKELLILALIGAICSIIGMYQEYSGHSEVIAGIDDKLSRNWHSLFNWNFWGSFLVAFIAAICSIVLAMIINTEVALVVTEAITDGYDIILKIMYLVLLKRMFTAYVSYEPHKS